MESLDAYGCDFDDWVCWLEFCANGKLWRFLPMKLKAQFDAVPRAAPFVLICEENQLKMRGKQATHLHSKN